MLGIRGTGFPRLSIKRFWQEIVSASNILAIDFSSWDGIAPIKGETKMARIEITPEGKAALFDGSTPVATYARKRDAVRGAARRGLQLA